MPEMAHEQVLIGWYDYRLIVLSVLIAVMASYAALDLGERVGAARGHLRRMWLLGGAVAMGTGIWSMHYVGMLAYSLPIPVSYDWPMVLWSYLAAVLASAVALWVASGTSLGGVRIGAGGVLMGIGIASMHYVGMEAMRLPAMCHYNPAIVLLSVVLAVVISLVALWLTFHLRSETATMGWRKMGSALVMGAAIPVMHYTGMAAVSFTPMSTAVDLTHAVEISSLGIVGIGAVTLLILGIAIFTSLIDRRFSAQALELERSEQRYRQLVETAKVVLWRAQIASGQLSYVNHEGEALLGYSPAEWTASPTFWRDHIHTDDLSRAELAWEAAAETGQDQKLEHRMIARDGRIVWLRTSIRIVDGAQPELVGVMTDITERKQAQEAAEEASQAKSALLSEVARLNQQLTQENSRMSAELDVTRRLQRMMVPCVEDLRAISELDISAFMESAAEVGGDYYDIIRDKNGVFVGIGDVTGHGLESGVVAIMVHTAIRTLLAGGRWETKDFFGILNRVIYENVRRMQAHRNLTLSLLHYQDGAVTISGQHEEVLVVRRDGVLERHDTLNLGFPLGLQDEIGHLVAESKVPLHAGDVLVVYTDGITEAINAAGVSYGIERLAAAVQAHNQRPAQEIREGVLNDLRTHVNGHTLLDDMSLLVLKPV